MNKIETYQRVVTSILEEYALYIPVNVPNSENQIISDLKGNHFQLVRLGWEDDEDFIYHLVFHFDIKSDGKVWIQATVQTPILPRN